MGFDLATAQPKNTGFDLSTAQPVDTKTGGNFLDRLGASFKMTNEGKVGYLESKLGKGNARVGDDGEILVKKNGKWTQFDESGFGVGDIADFAGDVPAMVGSAIGATVGAAGGGVGSVPGAAIGGAGGAAVKQAISAMMPGDDNMTALGRGGDLALNAAFAGGGQKVGNLIGTALAKNTARQVASRSSDPQIIIKVEGLLDQMKPDWRSLSTEAQNKAVEYVSRAIQSGADVSPAALANKALLEGLPVPVTNATKGQLGRNFFQQQNENMLADIPVIGKPLRETFESQQPLLAQNLDALIAKTGARSVNPREVGQGVQGNILSRYGASKAATKAAYDAAEAQDGNMASQVTPELLDWLDKYRGFQDESGMLTLAKKLGIVTEDASGNLAAGNAPLRNLYELRKAASTKSQANGNLGSLKSLIDDVFDNSGSTAYQSAAALRRQQGQTFEQGQKVISDLVKKGGNTTDQAINPENVFNRVILNGTKDDIRNLKSMLLSGDRAVRESGWQQLRNLRGQTLDYIKQASIEDLGSGEIMFKQGGLQRAINRIGEDNINEILGKKGAAELKTLAEAAKLLNKSKGNRTVGSSTAPRLAGMLMSLFDKLGTVGNVVNSGIKATQARGATVQPTEELIAQEARLLAGKDPTLRMLMGAGRLGGVAVAPDDYR